VARICRFSAYLLTLSPISCVPKPKVLWGWKRRSEPHAAPRHPPNPLGEAEEGQGAEGRESEKYIGKGVTNALFQDLLESRKLHEVIVLDLATVVSSGCDYIRIPFCAEAHCAVPRQ